MNTQAFGFGDFLGQFTPRGENRIKVHRFLYF